MGEVKFKTVAESVAATTAIPSRVNFRLAKTNRSKSVCTLFQLKHLNNQTVWPVIFGLTGPICARALKSQHMFKLHSRGHQDWPVKLVIHPESRPRVSTLTSIRIESFQPQLKR